MIDAVLEAGDEVREFLAPRQTLLGRGCVSQVGSALAVHATAQPARTRCAVVIADRVVAQTGLLNRLESGLREAGLRPVVFSDIAGEPTAEVVDAAIAVATDAGAGVVVGIGGGSAMDSAKLVALLLANASQDQDGREPDVRGWTGQVPRHAPVAPLALVPTTTGTGAEATRIAMVTVDGAKRIVSGPQLVPLVAALDSTLVASLPGPVVASTGMDAIAHAAESMMSTTRSVLSVAAAEQALRILLDALPVAVADSGHAGAREAALWGSHLAGLALNAGVVLGHSLAYCIAQHRPLPHGTTCALSLPYCLAYNAYADGQGAPRAHARLARLLTQGRSERLRDASEAVLALVERLGLPTTLAQVGMSGEEAGSMAGLCVRDYPRPNNPVPFDEERLHRLCLAMHAGDIQAAWAVHDDTAGQTSASPSAPLRTGATR